MSRFIRHTSFISSVLLTLCSILGDAQAQNGTGKFTLLKPEKTGLKFTNKVPENDSLHVLSYEYLYNGHGIGVGDFNNDGLDDVFISGNNVRHKLFLNRGSMEFDDITRTANVQGNGTWATGVSIADVNNDGLLDIYVCHSGKHSAARLANELFINTGVVDGKPVFADKAKELGIDAPGTQSTQAAFFDYDRDGDLDMFLLNHSMHTYSAFLNTRQRRATPDMQYGNRLFRNDLSTSGKYTDVTLQVGIINNAINYGLSVNISDLNQDGWPDIYTTSDYTEHDCYYVNNKNGTFTQSLQQSFPHISKFSMGADIADFNNDALPDVLTLDMLPPDNHRQKLLKGPDEYDQYQLLLDSGYYRQHMRNMLQLNRGTAEDGHVRFSDIGQLAGVSNTDWSWSGLFADFDSDGWKDLVVTNGYLRDFTDMDFLKYTMADAQLSEAAKGNVNFKNYSLVQKMPSNKLRNYFFRNSANLQFQDVSEQWGFKLPSVSNAAAYSDFDNDGDLDLIIGNNNEPVQLWRNDLHADHRWLEIRLSGTTQNKFALGAKVWLYQGKDIQYQELYPVRGFQSTVSPIVYFGLTPEKIDSVVVAWPNGRHSTLADVQPNQLLSIDDTKSSEPPRQNKIPAKKIFEAASSKTHLPFRHIENDFVDFKVEVLMPYQLSRMGPALAAADVNLDGLDDVFIGGAVGQQSQLFLQQIDGSFSASNTSPWLHDIAMEDVNALFFDVDKDGDADLYVVSGGNEYEDGAIEFQDRLYVNDGKGQFTKANGALPAMRSNKHAIAGGDYDGDGDLDLFIGGRGRSGFFPEPSKSFLLRNDSDNGKIRFTDVTDSVIPEARIAGMVTSANWNDLDGDGSAELIVAGDWMPILIFRNERGTFKNISSSAGTNELFGQWNTLTVVDVNGDGMKDILAGNCGLNHQFKPSPSQPMTIQTKDFDGNGNIDPIVSYYIGGKSYPLASRDELLDQIPSLKKKYIKYADYADATVEDIFGAKNLAGAKTLKCTETETILLIKQKDGKFSKAELPAALQFSPTYRILAEHLDDDNNPDLIFLGNFFGYRTQMGESDASYGAVVKNTGSGKFTSLAPAQTGLWANGDVRNAVMVKSANGERQLIIARNNDTPLVFKLDTK